MSCCKEIRAGSELQRAVFRLWMKIVRPYCDCSERGAAHSARICFVAAAITAARPGPCSAAIFRNPCPAIVYISKLTYLLMC